MKKDPTYSITKDDLVGIWEEDDTSDLHRGYFLFYQGWKCVLSGK